VSSAVGFGFERLPGYLAESKREFLERYLPEVMLRRAERGGLEEFRRDLLHDAPVDNTEAPDSSDAPSVPQVDN
jgi:hypothetical protein